MTPTEEIAHLKDQLVERDEAIRELNERASSHLITMLNTAQRLKLECDKLTAELRAIAEKNIPNPDYVETEPECVRFHLNKNNEFVATGPYLVTKKPEFFQDCIGVPLGIGKITAPQITKRKPNPSISKSEQPECGKP